MGPLSGRIRTDCGTALYIDVGQQSQEAEDQGGGRFRTNGPEGLVVEGVNGLVRYVTLKSRVRLAPFFCFFSTEKKKKCQI